MEDESVPVAPAGAASADDGTAAVLYGMFTAFTEALGDLDERLSAIEAAVRAGPPGVEHRLAGVEGSIGHLADLVRSQAELAARAATALPEGPTAEVTALADMLRRRSELADQHAAAVAAALASVQALLQAHVDETTHSLGRRAGEAGRRLASDLGLRGRPKPPPLGQ